MISNPCTWFSGGGSFGDQKEFTYGPGEDVSEYSMLWHTSPRLNNLSTTMEMNVVWFADSVQQARERLKSMLEFRIECGKEQELYLTGTKPIHYEEFAGRNQRNIETAYKMLELIENKKILIMLAPPNQFFEIGWASNDTIL